MTDCWRKKYEEEFCQLVDAAGARAFGLGRHALVILLKALGVNQGDKIGVCSFTCLSVVEAIKVCGAIPVYLDLDEHLCIDPQEILKHPANSLKAVILQHTFGVPGRLDELLDACKKNNAAVIEDCAHAFGCTWDGKPLGSFGIAAIYSFQWGKPYTTGQGGMLTVNSKTLLGEVDDQISQIAVAMSPMADFTLLAQRTIYKWLSGKAGERILKSIYFKLRDIGIVSGSFKLDCDFTFYPGYVRLAGEHVAKAGLAALDNWPLREKLKKLNTAIIEQEFERANIPIWPKPAKAQVTFLRYPVSHPRKEEVLKRAGITGCDIAGWYNTPVHPLSGSDLAKVDYQPGSCPKAELFVKRVVHIPTATTMDKLQLDKIISILSTT